MLLVHVTLNDQGVAAQQPQQGHKVHRVGRDEGPLPRRGGHHLPSTGRKVGQEKARNHVDGQVDEHGGVAVHVELQLLHGAGQRLPFGRLALHSGTGDRELLNQLGHVILDGGAQAQRAVCHLQNVQVPLGVHRAKHVELHLRLTQLVGDELEVAGRGLDEGGNQLLISGGARHDAAALNLFLQLKVPVTRLLAPRFGFAALARAFRAHGFVRVGGRGGAIPQARELVDGPLLALQVGGDAVHPAAVLPGVRRGVPVGSVHTASLADKPQQGSGHVVDGRFVALAGVNEIAGDVGGVLTVVQGKTHPERNVSGEPGQLFVVAVKRGLEHRSEFRLRLVRGDLPRGITSRDAFGQGASARQSSHLAVLGFVRLNLAVLGLAVLGLAGTRVLALPVLLVLSHCPSLRPPHRAPYRYGCAP